MGKFLNLHQPRNIVPANGRLPRVISSHASLEIHHTGEGKVLFLIRRGSVTLKTELSLDEANAFAGALHKVAQDERLTLLRRVGSIEGPI